MSRRYGRNQKRRHREEIARLSLAHGMDDMLIKLMGKDLREAQDKLAEMLMIIESVCFNSVAIPAKTVKGDYPTDKYTLPLREKIDFSSAIGAVSSSYATFKTVNLYALRDFLEARKESFQLSVHLEYAAGKHSAYMISEEALYSMPRESLLHKLLPDMGRKLIEHLRQK